MAFVGRIYNGYKRLPHDIVAVNCPCPQGYALKLGLFIPIISLINFITIKLISY